MNARRFTAVVIGVDAGGAAETAVEAAVTLARESRAVLHIVAATGAGIQSLTAPLIDQVEQAAEAAAREGVDTYTHVRVGDPGAAIAAVADEESANLIVVGRRRNPGLRRALLGSVSAGLVAGAPVAVLVVPVGQWPPQRIVVGDDATIAAGSARELGIHLAHVLHAELLLVDAIPEAAGAAAAHADPHPLGAQLVVAEHERLSDAASAASATLRRHVATSITVESPADALAGVLGDGERSLVVLGHHRHSRLGRLFRQSTATNLLGRTDAALLVVPAADS